MRVLREGAQLLWGGSDSQEVGRHGDAPVQHELPPIPVEVEDVEGERRQHEAPTLQALEHVLVQLLGGVLCSDVIICCSSGA